MIIMTFPDRVKVMGVPLDPFTMSQTVSKTKEFIDAGVFAHLIGVNADKYLQMIDSKEMDSLVKNCELINADGASMVLAAKILGVEIPERVAGVDLMYELCSLANDNEYKVYLLGAKDSVVKETKDALISLYPNIDIIGCRDGYFSPDDWFDISQDLKRLNPDIIFVGITSPIKENLIEYFRSQGMRGAYVGVGGSFDVVSGNIARAPKWVQNIKLEWLFRLLQEPKRLFKRYAVGNTRFIRLVYLERKAIRKGER